MLLTMSGYASVALTFARRSFNGASHFLTSSSVMLCQIGKITVVSSVSRANSP
jgi:hypothetical protein